MIRVSEAELSFSPLDSAQSGVGCVHIWLLDLEKIQGEKLATQESVLSSEELRRANSFKQRRQEFIATRLFMRLCLARYAGLPPAALKFSTGASGKPFLTANTPHPTPSRLPLPEFNLSHCGNLAVLAVSDFQVGLDIETPRKRTFMSIAERYFHPDELRQLQAAATQDQQQLFFKFWTLKEAFFKALGGGIATGLDKVNFNLQPNQPGFSFDPALGQRENDWQFFQTKIFENTWLSLATQSPTLPQVAWFSGLDLFGD